jgi:hypothetical protein
MTHYNRVARVLAAVAAGLVLMAPRHLAAEPELQPGLEAQVDQVVQRFPSSSLREGVPLT